MARKAQWPPPVYSRRGRDVLRVYQDGKPRDYPLGPTGSPEARAAYLRKVAELEAAGQNPMPSAPDDLRVTDVVTRFLAWAEGHYDPAGREPAMFFRSVQELLALYGPTPAARLGPKDLKIVLGEMAKRLSRRVANRRLTRIKTLWKWAESEELVPRGSYHALATVRGLTQGAKGVREGPGVRPTSGWALGRAAAKAPPAVSAMLRLQWRAGMRSCEVRILRTCDVDRSGPVWLYRPGRHKNQWRGQDRVIALGPKCQRLLAPFLRDDAPEGYCFRPRANAGHSKVIRYREKCYSDIGYAQAVRRACLAAGVAPFRPYGGRHAAKMRLTRQLGADAARAVLGQKSIETTAHYGSIDIAHASEAMRKLG